VIAQLGEDIFKCALTDAPVSYQESFFVALHLVKKQFCVHAFQRNLENEVTIEVSKQYSPGKQRFDKDTDVMIDELNVDVTILLLQ